eukprot:2460017-Prorocentrum_lima.AAC.1
MSALRCNLVLAHKDASSGGSGAHLPLATWGAGQGRLWAPGGRSRRAGPLGAAVVERPVWPA